MRHPLRQDPVVRRRARLVTEAPREGALRHRRAAGQDRHGEVLGKVGADPVQHRSEAAVGDLAHRRGHELRLTSLALRWDDHPPGDAVRGPSAVRLPNEIETQVDPRGCPGAGEDRSVLDEQDIGDHVDVRELVGEPLGVLPVRRRPATVPARLDRGEGPAAQAHHGAPRSTT